MDYQTGHVMTLANSIIGVSVLAMPYCFKQCGIVLSILMLLISSIISRLACHFLVKSAIIARRKTFEFLAYYIFGAMGKFAIEVGIIGFLIGTCIAFFVVMGDLGPEIISEITGSYTTNTMRTSILMALALFCVLPLGLLRNVDSLHEVSKATIGFYCCLVLKIVFEAIPHIFNGDWYHSVNFWRPAGILQCLPIFTMALFCQAQLFEIYQALQNATLEKMNNLVRVAVNICTCVYIFVGVFGYIAFFQKPFTGNILLSFSPSLMTDVMKIGFILSVAFSFPLVIFPCRASLYSLLYKEGYPVHEGMSTYIPEGRFKGLTLFIVFISLIIGIMIPNIELVLGLVGSTIGVMICVLFPVTCFICISPKNTNERILAQLMLMIGIFVMVLGTYKNLYSLDSLESNTVTISSLKNFDQLDLNVGKVLDKIEVERNNVVDKVPTTVKVIKINIENNVNVAVKATTKKVIQEEELKEIRHEPPQPIEPVEEVDLKKENESPPKPETELKPEQNIVEVKDPPEIPLKLIDISNRLSNDSKNDEVDIEAIKKEDKEVEQQENEKIKQEDTNKVLIETIQQHNEAHKEIVEQQKKINEEKVKAMKEIESIARQAIEKISGGQNDNQVVADAEKHIKENVKLDINGKLENDDVKEQNVLNSNSNINKKDDLNGGIIQQKLEAGPDALINKDDKQENVILKETKENTNDKSKNEDVRKDKLSDNIKSDDTNKKPVKIEEQPASLTDNVAQGKNIPNKNESKVEDNKNIPQPNKTLESIQGSLSSQSNVKQNINNTAPLFLALGKPDLKVEENSIPKMVPIPLAKSANFANNLSQPESPAGAPKEALEAKAFKEPPFDSKEELKVMRRDILSLKDER